MHSATRRRAAVATLATTAALSFSAVLPAAASAAALGTTPTTPTVLAAAAPESCTITDATVTWGFKESFRSYISGSIAKGAWEPFGGVTYATPAFTWTGGTGEFDPATGAGTVTFPGGIRFTGHGGLLDTTVQNATLSIAAGSGQVLVDLAGVSMESALAGDDTVETQTQVPLVTLDLAALTVEQSDETLALTATDAATAITAEGFEAFGNYETGTAFDPLTLTATGACAAPTPTPDATPEATETEAAVDASDAETASGDGPPAALITVIVSSVAGAIAATVAGIVGVRAARKRREAAAAASGDDGPSA